MTSYLLIIAKGSESNSWSLILVIKTTSKETEYTDNHYLLKFFERCWWDVGVSPELRGSRRREASAAATATEAGFWVPSLQGLEHRHLQ